MTAWPEELPLSLDYPTLPVGAVLVGAAHRYGTRVAYQHNDRSITFADVLEQASAFAHALADHGVGRGDVVALHLPNCPEYAIAYYGTMLSGATFSPTNPLLPVDHLRHQLEDCQARVAVTTAVGAAAIAEVRNDTNVKLVVQLDGDAGSDTTTWTQLLSDRPTTPPPVEVDVDDLAHIAYTGGTTGLSKGVELTHRNVVTNILQFASWLHGCVPDRDGIGGLRLNQIGSETQWPTRLGTGVVINVTPWFHAMGCIGSMSVPLLAGVTTILHDRFDPQAYVAAAAEHKVTSISGAPTLFAALLDVAEATQPDLASVRFISSGAAPLAHHHIQRLNATFPHAAIAEGYGLTEATMGVTLTPATQTAVRKIGSVGLPVFDTRIELRDSETGEIVPVGTPGEVFVRGPQVMQRYRNRKDETDDVLIDGWLRTGDVGYVDDDGYLFLVDRTKDMLIYKGYNVYPREIEEMMISRTDVHTAAVVGRYDADLGDLPVAFVVPAGDGRDAEGLMAEVNRDLPPYKRLRELYFVDSLPVSAAGKVLKRELRERLS
jgi:long-chain acyl-CoA synthetase